MSGIKQPGSLFLDGKFHYYCAMGPLQLSDHVVRQTGEQMTHWNKENSNLVALSNMFQYFI